MCVLALAWSAHPRWTLVLAGNRDEYHDRPAAPLARWEDNPSLIAGRDLRSGGTWLGISERGRCVVVTNRRGFGPPEPDRPSRGALVTDLLAGGDLDRVALDRYNPVNLIMLESRRADFLSNRPGPVRTALTPGVHGLSNGQLDEPWPKTLRLTSILRDWLDGPADDPALLLDGLREERLTGAELDAASPSEISGGPLPGPIFIRDPLYGTRCSSVIAIDRSGYGLFVERRFSANGAVTGETRLPFRWARGDIKE